MANKRQNKKVLGAGGIVALVIAGLALVAILVGVVYYVHSGRAGMGQSAGLITANETTLVTQKTTELDKESAEEAEDADAEAEDADAADSSDSSKSNKTAKASDSKESSTPKDSAASSSSGSIYKKKTTAKKLGKLYDADTDAFREAYYGKTVTVSGKLVSKSAKMLYVELDTGTKVPMRVYLNSEEQREQFNKIDEGTTITVKGTVGVLYPMQSDAGGFQDMKDGLFALDTVTLVK